MGFQECVDGIQQMWDDIKNQAVDGGYSQAYIDAIDAQVKANVITAQEALDKVNAAYIGQSAASIGYATKADLDADLTPADGVLAIVTNDATAANNGTYRKSGDTGTGSWVQSSNDRISLVENKLSKKASLSTGKNMVDESKLTPDKFVDTTGTIGDSTSYSHSSRIYCSASTDYVTSTRLRFITFYDSSDAVINGLESLDVNTSFQTPVNTRYFIATFYNADSNYQIEEGTISSTYEQYKESLVQSQIPNNVTNLLNKIDPLETRVSTTEQDIKNKADLTIGKNILNLNNLTYGAYLNDTGVETAYSAYNYTDFLNVQPNTTYTMNKNYRYVCFYDINKNVVAGGESAAGSTFTTLSNVAYIRVTVYASDTDIQLEAGSVSTAYEPYEKTISVTLLKDKSIGNSKIQEKAISVQNTDFYTIGKNLFDKSKTVVGEFINTSGVASSLATYSHSDFIPVEQSTIYSCVTTRFSTFYDANKNVVAGGTNGLHTTFTTTPDTAYVIVSFYTTDVDDYMLAKGSILPDYEPYGYVLDTSKYQFLSQSERKYSLNLGGDNSVCYVRTVLDNGDVKKRTFKPYPLPSLTNSDVFNLYSEYYNDINIKDGGDDAAPYRAFNPVRTIGANHGWSIFECTASAHGKTDADVGSIYSDGTYEFVLIAIIDVDNLYLARKIHGTVSVANITYAYVSGGVTTTDIVISGVTEKQWYSGTTNRTINTYVDGVELASNNGNYEFNDNVAFVEQYDILPYSELIAWYENNANAGTLKASGNAAFTVTLTHVFDKSCNYTLLTDFLARVPMQIQDIMFTQATRMVIATDGAISYYIPNSLPFVHESINYDWANIDATDTTSWVTRADFTPDRCRANAMKPDRVVQLSNSYYSAIGYLPVGSTSLTDRPNLTTNKALQLSTNNAKIYLSALDIGTHDLAVGEYFSTIAYRSFGKRPIGKTCDYLIRTQSADYLYLDWHNETKFDKVVIDNELIGRDFSIVDAYNVILHSQSLTATLLIDVATSGTYGYLILKISK